MKNIKWSKEMCAKEALKYTTITELIKNNPKAYKAIYRKGWRDDICKHMICLKRPNNYWNKERCVEEALKYTTMKELEKNNPKMLNSIYKKGWKDEICSHMINNKWSKEKLIEIALKYNDRSDFRKYEKAAYTKSVSHGCLDEVCSHMPKIGNLRKRCIYVYEFPDNHAYLGLTCNFKKRCKNRLYNKKDSPTKHITETGLIPIIKQLTDYLDCEIAIKTEIENIIIYKNLGWIVLNKTLGGETGSTGKKWSFVECKKEALNYNNRHKFKEKKSSVYKSAKINGWLDEICDHMVKINTNKIEEDYNKIALKYKTLTEFQKNEKVVYSWAQRHKILDKICSHMARRIKPKKYWTFERCAEEALKYTQRTQFFLNSGGAVGMAKRNGWYEDICKHMPNTHKPNNYWNYERCKEEALKYTSRVLFNDECGSAVDAAIKNGWYKELTKHMPYTQKPNNYWTYERCKEEGLKYDMKSKFNKESGGAFDAAKRNGWLTEITAHMKNKYYKFITNEDI